MEERCASDPILAIKYANPAKSLEKALNYVAHEVQKSGLTIMDSDSGPHIRHTASPFLNLRA